MRTKITFLALALIATAMSTAPPASGAPVVVKSPQITYAVPAASFAPANVVSYHIVQPAVETATNLAPQAEVVHYQSIFTVLALESTVWRGRRITDASFDYLNFSNGVSRRGFAPGSGRELTLNGNGGASTNFDNGANISA